MYGKSWMKLTREPLPVDDRSAGRTPELLGRVLRIIDSGPAPFFRAAIVSLAVTGILGIAVALGIRPPGAALPAPQRDMIEAAAIVLIAIAVLLLAAVLLAARIRPVKSRVLGWLERVIAAPDRAAIWLALALWFPTLLIIAYFRAKATLPPTVQWIAFGFLDKRWETSACLLGALAPMLLLVASARVLKIGREHPQTWRSWLSGIVPRSNAPQASAPEGAEPTGETARAETARARIGRFARIGAGILTAVGLAYYCYGPPWYLDRAGGYIGYQEDVFLQGMQAISRGHLAYLGPASIQYGPGTQAITYFFMRHLFTFSVVGFRESWATFQWVGASIFFVALFLAFGYARGFLASLLIALVYPAQVLIGFTPGGAYTGYFGWANPLRYAGAVALIVLLPAVIRRSPSLRGYAGAVALGLFWGGSSYLAQENLIAGAVGALAVGALLLLTGTASGRAATRSLLGVLAGFVLAWAPVLVFYAIKGALARFLYLYFLIPQAVSAGYSNTPFGGTDKSAPGYALTRPWVHIFEFVPVIVAVLALLAVVRFRPFRVAEEWSRDRIMLVTVVVTTILLYQGALLRSDIAHLTGTMLIFPALVVVAATTLPRLVLPRLSGFRQPVALGVAGIALFAGAIWLLPPGLIALSSIREQAEVPYLARQQLAARAVPSTPPTVAGQRVGAGLANAPTCCQHATESMPRFVSLMDHIHAIVGDRTTYVVGTHDGYPGLIYFVADLEPAPIPADPYTLIFTQQQMTAYLRTFQTSVLPQTQAIVTADLQRPEVRYFLQRYADARQIVLSYQSTKLYVLLSS